MPRFLFTDINKKILITENPFLKTYFIYYLTVKFLSDGGFSDRNTQKICLWRFMTRTPQQHAASAHHHFAPTTLRAARNTASRSDFAKKVGFSYLLGPKTTCSRPSNVQGYVSTRGLGIGMSARKPTRASAAS